MFAVVSVNAFAAKHMAAEKGASVEKKEMAAEKKDMKKDAQKAPKKAPKKAAMKEEPKK